MLNEITKLKYATVKVKSIYVCLVTEMKLRSKEETAELRMSFVLIEMYGKQLSKVTGQRNDVGQLHIKKWGF